MNEISSLTLESLGSGGVQEIFQRELQRILLNIKDPNTSSKTKRSMTITVTFGTNEARTAISMETNIKTKLAHEESLVSQAFIRLNASGQPEAIEFNPDQLGIFDEPQQPLQESNKVYQLKN